MLLQPLKIIFELSVFYLSDHIYFFKAKKWLKCRHHDNQYNDTRHNDTQHNGTEHDDTQLSYTFRQSE